MTEAELGAHLMWLRETLVRIDARCESIETDVNVLLRSHIATETLAKQHVAKERLKNVRLGFVVTVTAALTSGLVTAVMSMAFPSHAGG